MNSGDRLVGLICIEGELLPFSAYDERATFVCLDHKREQARIGVRGRDDFEEPRMQDENVIVGFNASRDDADQEQGTLDGVDQPGWARELHNGAAMTPSRFPLAGSDWPPRIPVNMIAPVSYTHLRAH